MKQQSTKQQVTLPGGQQLNYQLRISRRARRITLSAYLDGSVVVSMPCGTKTKEAEKFIKEKSKWLLAKINPAETESESHTSKENLKNYIFYKDQALNLAKERLSHYNQNYGFCYNKISIKNQKTRWGSCSKKGNLNFNYRILFLSPRIRDYIIVHELCHLKELNHSKNFWKLVAQTFPDYKEIRKETRDTNFNCYQINYYGN